MSCFEIVSLLSSFDFIKLGSHLTKIETIFAIDSDDSVSLELDERNFLMSSGEDNDVSRCMLLVEFVRRR